jgi:glyoxylase-like metal-dependent hydrolase (beta-lactamase superfamily II)
VLAPNPGIMTLDGTNTWVLRASPEGRALVVDPGPLDRGHLDAVATLAGDVVAVDGLEVHVVGTPGHTSDSLSFVLPQERAVLTGDTVLGRGTTVVAHPDGQLGAYLDSLHRLHALAEAQDVTTVWPGHGPVIDDALGALDFYLAHRRERLEQVREAMRTLDPTADDLARRVVETVYADVDPVLWGAAELSVRAQIEYLRGQR